jgi:hypothetical protein
MSKIAGLKGRSPETYPDPSTSGSVSTRGEPGPGVTLTTTASPIITPLTVAVEDGDKIIVTISGTVDGPSLSPALASFFIQLDNSITISVVEVALSNSPQTQPVSFSAIGELPDLIANPATSVGVLGEVDRGTASVIDVSVTVIVSST